MTTGPKVFGIGFHKTGTTSLGQALTTLGYRVGDWFPVSHPSTQEVLRRAFAELDQYDAFQDNPWPLLYRELDERCPGSKFILTLRPMEEWIASLTEHFGKEDTAMRTWIYGVGHPAGNEGVFVERHEAHIAEVKEYFRNRPDDLLVLRLTEGEGWAPLSAFLRKPVPPLPFPHANPREVRARPRTKERVRRRLRRVLR